MTIEQWVARCARCYAQKGQMADDVADEMAQSFADMHKAKLGNNVAQWPDPEVSAAEDIAGWTED